jgi:Sugar-specific transcriptional regulator TrmB
MVENSTMKNLPAKFKESLQEKLLELLWRQWRTLGIASHGPEADHLLDLEALILATAVMGEQDRRLWTGALQWLFCSREWVSLSRLKRMAAAFIRPDAFLNIPLINKMTWEEALSSLGPGFSSRNAAVDKLRVDQVTTSPRLKKLPLLQLYLRGIFGVNARAELFLYLLVKGEGNSNQIARQTHYDQKNVYRILERWAETGFVDRESRGKQNLYALESGRNFVPDVETITGFWDWDIFFTIYSRLHIAAHNEPWAADAYLLSSLFRDVHPQAARIAKSIGKSLPDPKLYSGEEYFAPGSRALLDLFSLMADRAGGPTKPHDFAE